MPDAFIFGVLALFAGFVALLVGSINYTLLLALIYVLAVPHPVPDSRYFYIYVFLLGSSLVLAYFARWIKSLNL